MAGDLDTFQERLNRINAQHGGRGGAKLPPRSPVPTAGLPPPRQHAVGSGRIILRLLTAGGLAVGTAMVLVVLSQTMATGPFAIVQHIQAEPGEAQSGLQSLLNRVASVTSPEPELAPVDYLPVAPARWVRVTQADARQPDILDRLQQDWPRTGIGVSPITQHPAWPRLQDFVQSNANPDIETRVLSRSVGSGIYMGPRGEYAFVRLSLKGERTAFGDPTDTEAWLDAMAELVRGDMDDNEMIEKVTLSGIRMVNLTKKPGESLITRPIGSDVRTPNGMQLFVPLTHRAMLDIRALAEPDVIGELIASIDRDTLQARLD